MGLESVTTITDLNSAWPLGSDVRSDGDGHVRAVKVAVKSLLTNVHQIGFHTQDETLTTPTRQLTWAGSTPIEGQRLTVFVIQDATGGRAITWDAAKFKYATTTIKTDANGVTVFEFVGKADGFWYMVATPLQVA